MLECKDCCLYNTEACRYGRYALEHNMSLNCDDFIVEHNKAYQQGRAEAEKELQGLKDLGRLYSEIRAEAISEYKSKSLELFIEYDEKHGYPCIADIREILNDAELIAKEKKNVKSI